MLKVINLLWLVVMPGLMHLFLFIKPGIFVYRLMIGLSGARMIYDKNDS